MQKLAFSNHFFRFYLLYVIFFDEFEKLIFALKMQNLQSNKKISFNFSFHFDQLIKSNLCQTNQMNFEGTKSSQSQKYDLTLQNHYEKRHFYGITQTFKEMGTYIINN